MLIEKQKPKVLLISLDEVGSGKGGQEGTKGELAYQ